MISSVRQRKSDYWLSLAVFSLIIFGLIMIYSVSKYYSLNVTDGETDKYYLMKQLTSLIVGVIAWIVFQAIDYNFWKKYLGHLFFITLGLLLLPFILSPFGVTVGGRWIVIGSFNFQPAELAKLTFVLYISGMFAAHDKSLKDVSKLFWPFITIVGSIAAIMLLQKDLGTLAIFVVISSAVFIFAGAPFYQLFAATGSAAFLLWLAIKIEPYRMQRLTTFLNPGSDASNTGYHIQNALIAIGSGGLWGLGFGQSKQKYLYLPEAHTDSIFAIICEEIGMIRSSFVILVFAFIAYRGINIARRAPDTFSRLIAIGITSWLFFQMAINIAAMFSLVPLTGIPLPFISYGGTSLIVMLSAVGILTNISKSQIYEKK